MPTTETANDEAFLSYLSPQELLAWEKEYLGLILNSTRNKITVISDDIRRRVEETTADYTQHLIDSWERNNAVSAEVDSFLKGALPIAVWTKEQWAEIKRLLTLIIDVDKERDFYAGGEKIKADKTVSDLNARYHFTDEEMAILQTPSFETFYEKYFFDHMEYHLGLNDGTHLVELYHCGRRELFEARQKKFAFEKTSVDKLHAMLREYEQQWNERFAKKCYFMIERPDIQAFERLLACDNIDEYMWIYTLRGLPKFVLRKEIVRRLVGQGKMPNEPYFSVPIAKLIEIIGL